MAVSLRRPLLRVSGYVLPALSLLMLIQLFAVVNVAAQSGSGWDKFAKVRFKEKFFREQNEYFLVPVFESSIREMEGKEIVLRGHYIPMDLDPGTIMLSKFPYSACFFCGGAGPESIAEVIFSDKPPRLKADQVIQVRGTLSLNDSDVMHMNFILRNAKLEK